uniref:Wsv432-like protein n=1 Tax=Metapenaeus ensis nimavirus TaxID=2133794 RepID=A0A401IPD5_9VIRU|nr:MAG: wsv432-like protein [Metapenaeus ensis nimavirus]GBG35479.1 wsv432-like protein [Metapenaeus ensis nimavirus]
MSVPVPSVILNNKAIAASSIAIAIHSLAEHADTGKADSEQGSRISISTAYLTIPEAIRKTSFASAPIVYDTLSGRYFPDPCWAILNDSLVTVRDFKNTVVVDLTPLFS